MAFVDTGGASAVAAASCDENRRHAAIGIDAAVVVVVAVAAAADGGQGDETAATSASAPEELVGASTAVPVAVVALAAAVAAAITAVEEAVADEVVVIAETNVARVIFSVAVAPASEAIGTGFAAEKPSASRPSFQPSTSGGSESFEAAGESAASASPCCFDSATARVAVENRCVLCCANQRSLDSCTNPAKATSSCWG